MANIIKVSEFTIFPGPRYKSLGTYSGEEFRDNHLIPAINKHGEHLIVDLDGTMGFGSSFLEECFGGLIRKGLNKDLILKIVKNIKSKEDESLKIEIENYIKEASN